MVSVIIPTRNRLAFLKEAMASVSAQDYPDRETIVVDDVSEDGTWEWLSSVQDPRVQILRPPNHAERSAARNLGLRNAKGDFVMFLDDDDLLVPGALTALAKALSLHPEALAVVGARIYFDVRGRWYRPPHPRRAFTRRAWPDILFGWVPPQGQSLIRKEAVFAAGGWNEGWSVGEDHEFWLRLISEGSVIAFIPKLVGKIRNHPGQTHLILRRRSLVTLRRDFVRRLPQDLQPMGRKLHQAERLQALAGRFRRRCNYRKAFYFELLAMARALRTLPRPVQATFLLGGPMELFAGIILGKSVVARVQEVKGFLRGELAKWIGGPICS